MGLVMAVVVVNPLPLLEELMIPNDGFEMADAMWCWLIVEEERGTQSNREKGRLWQLLVMLLILVNQSISDRGKPTLLLSTLFPQGCPFGVLANVLGCIIVGLVGSSSLARSSRSLGVLAHFTM